MHRHERRERRRQGQPDPLVSHDLELTTSHNETFQSKLPRVFLPRSFGLSSLRLGALGGAIAATLLGLAARAPADEKFMKLEDVKPGMKGYGLTVFRGTKPERFDVEIVSTMRNFKPHQSLILIKTKHPRLDVARTVAGMSGSPIFLDGKMIGAYAYGWLFGVEPLAGVTPIHNMLDDLRRPIPPSIAPAPGRAPLPAPTEPVRPKRRAAFDDEDRPNRFAGAPLDYDLVRHGEQVGERVRAALAAPSGSGLERANTDVMISGFGPRSAQFAAELFEPLGMTLQQGGGAGGESAPPADGPSRFVDGGVVTVQMLRGDVSASGLGTVTYVDGDKLVAFGHPMMMNGLSELPTAMGYVHWVLATHNRSFKLGEPTTPLGTLVNDRQASIVVDQTRVAPTFPITVDIRGVAGAPFTHWEMVGTRDQFMAPNIAALAIGSALESTAAEHNDQTWRATSKLRVDGGQLITLEDFGSGSGSTLGAKEFSRTRLIRAMGALLNNRWRVGTIESVETTVDFVMRREVSILRGAELLDAEVDAGGTVRIRLTLQNYRGAERTEVIAIPLPKHVESDNLRIDIRPAHMVDRNLADPESYDDLVKVLDQMDYPAESLLVSYTLPDEASVAFDGKVASRIPPGMADLLTSRSDSLGPSLDAAQARILIPMKGFVVGDETVNVKVRPILR